MFRMVCSWGMPAGKPLGRTFTPSAPVSRARSTKPFASSTLRRRTAGSGDSNSAVEPKLSRRILLRANRSLTFKRASTPIDGSTPCLCWVRNSTASNSEASRLRMMVSRSQSFRTLYVTAPIFKVGNSLPARRAGAHRDEDPGRQRRPFQRSPHLSFCRSTSKNSMRGGRIRLTNFCELRQMTRSWSFNGSPTCPSMVR